MLKRDAYWDVVKGVGIMLVLMGHLLRYGSFPSRVIFNFHMPLFFFASGVFFRPDGISNMRELIGKIVRNLGIPWVYFCLICVAPYWVINGTIVPSTGVRIMVERFWRGNPHFCNSLWFVSCLAVAQFCFYCIRNYSGKTFSNIWSRAALLGALLCLAYACGNAPSVVQRYAPLQLLNVPMALFWVIAGSLFGREVRDCILNVKQGGMALCAIVLVIVSKMCGMSNMANAEYQSVIVYPITAACGILATMIACRYVSRSSFLAWVGRHSLTFFLIEWFVIAAVVRLVRLYDRLTLSS